MSRRYKSHHGCFPGDKPKLNEAAGSVGQGYNQEPLVGLGQSRQPMELLREGCTKISRKVELIG